MKFNEDSRVKIPAILHLSRLGYTYLSLKGLAWDETSNIVPSIFRTSVAAINPAATPADIDNALGQLGPLLDNEDLGKQFYEKITETSGLNRSDRRKEKPGTLCKKPPHTVRTRSRTASPRRLKSLTTFASAQSRPSTACSIPTARDCRCRLTGGFGQARCASLQISPYGEAEGR